MTKNSLVVVTSRCALCTKRVNSETHKCEGFSDFENGVVFVFVGFENGEAILEKNSLYYMVDIESFEQLLTEG